ncbi:dTDP-4-dehydrorhamnose reductase [Rhizobium sp. BK661]|uniref:dTDP-4-dehydrorhamnose reductase n=1 Tax=Rhizobium sp. BK661 TaxID=2586991 RepID=UPI00216825F6|nr:dTDP-4-dehydrorhamnose reductase [Rhizobium sp. BK661]MCS3744345.1 dTDP-4-dehydrorhamnose reductase [Rhizobium sp. BK661]
MRMLVFGQTGQVASELQRFTGITALGRDEADLNDADACIARVREASADVVINAAAYTAVDSAESDAAQAYRVNAETVGSIARVAAERGLPFLHISTDYVFDGTGERPWREVDKTAPLSVYGSSKLSGEGAVQAAGGCHAILRTSWVISAHGKNFVKTMLRLGAERKVIRVVADQTGAPTCARDIAATLVEMARQLRNDPSKAGIYHYSGAPDITWAGFAREIFRQADLDCRVEDIPSAAYPTVAKRPANSRLDCGKIEMVFGVTRPDWRVGLSDILTDLKVS